jgi:hypothetical protein
LGTFSRYVATTRVNRGENRIFDPQLLRNKSATTKTSQLITLIERIPTDPFGAAGPAFVKMAPESATSATTRINSG